MPAAVERSSGTASGRGARSSGWLRGLTLELDPGTPGNWRLDDYRPAVSQDHAVSGDPIIIRLRSNAHSLSVIGQSGKGRSSFFKNKRARVSLTLRLICWYRLMSLQPFLTSIYETLLDIEIHKIRLAAAHRRTARKGGLSCSETAPVFAGGGGLETGTRPGRRRTMRLPTRRMSTKRRVVRTSSLH